MRRLWLTGVSAALLLAAPGLAWRLLSIPESAPPAPVSAGIAARYVGADSCKQCHPRAFSAWTDSDHAKSMARADDTSVLGDFNDVRFEGEGISAEFFRRHGGWYVRTEGTDGQPQEFQIAYTFGHDPLQQYLIPFPDGRLQALSVAWDSRTRAQGGQRWFHLYADEHIDHHDALHWTGAAMNWNGMCAECHSTGLQQRFDAASGHFDASWSEINVACEACHGPASRHLEWASAPDAGVPLKGLTFALRGSTQDDWQFIAGHPTARSQNNIAPNRGELDTCAYCHSRRATLAAHSRPGQPLAATHQLALLEEDLYFPDGQQKDEVFEYGSFLQSRMFQAGVTCSNCHHPHSGRLRAEGNALCAQCHQPAVFDTTHHHGHPHATAGSQCVNCHMPARTYMQVDARRDHSFLIPRPDLAETLDTPDPCTVCHREHTPSWAAGQIKHWSPQRIHPQHFAEVLHAGRRWQPGAPKQLQQLVSDLTQPGIIRATALQLLARWPGQRLSQASEIAAMDEDPLLRQQAAAVLPDLPPAQTITLGQRLLADPMLTVRVEAAQQLLQASPEITRSLDAERWQQALEEFRTGLEAQRHRAEALSGLAVLAQHRGDAREAEALLKEAIARQPQYPPGWISLSEILWQQGQVQPSQALLQRALDAMPGAAELHYALAISQIRTGNPEAALSALNQAVQLAAEIPQYHYAHAIALHETGHREQALKVLLAATQHFPGHVDLLMLLAQYATAARQWPLARQAAVQLQEIDPDDPGSSQLQKLLSEVSMQ